MRQRRDANGRAQSLAVWIGFSVGEPDREFPAHAGPLGVNGAAYGSGADFTEQGSAPSALRRSFHACPEPADGFGHVIGHLAVRMGIGFSKIKGDAKMAAARSTIRARAWIAIGRVNVDAAIRLDGNDLPNLSFGHDCKVEKKL